MLLIVALLTGLAAGRAAFTFPLVNSHTPPYVPKLHRNRCIEKAALGRGHELQQQQLSEDDGGAVRRWNEVMGLPGLRHHVEGRAAFRMLFMEDEGLPIVVVGYDAQSAKAYVDAMSPTGISVSRGRVDPQVPYVEDPVLGTRLGFRSGDVRGPWAPWLLLEGLVLRRRGLQRADEPTS